LSIALRGANGARRGTELGIKAAEIRCNQQRDTAETIIETITQFGKGWTTGQSLQMNGLVLIEVL